VHKRGVLPIWLASSTTLTMPSNVDGWISMPHQEVKTCQYDGRKVVMYTQNHRHHDQPIILPSRPLPQIQRRAVPPNLQSTQKVLARVNYRHKSWTIVVSSYRSKNTHKRQPHRNLIKSCYIRLDPGGWELHGDNPVRSLFIGFLAHSQHWRIARSKLYTSEFRVNC
jgi:hypothetical protein